MTQKGNIILFGFLNCVKRDVQIEYISYINRSSHLQTVVGLKFMDVQLCSEESGYNEII